MLTTSQIAAQSARDYYGKMAKLSSGTSYWYGRGAQALGHGIGTEINADELYALCAMGPGAAKRLEAGLPLNISVEEFEAHQASLTRKRRAGLDLTFSAPKSVSLTLLGHPDEKTRQVFELSHWLAVTEALRFLQKKAGLSRMTINGEVFTVHGEMIFAGFTHFTNRNIEPHLHSHVIVPNVVRCEDGKWRSLDNEEFYQWYMVAGAIYRASLREHVQRLTNAEFVMADGWKYEIGKLADWKSSDGAKLLPAFSLRHEEVAEEAERIREITSAELSPKVRRSLGVRTRKAKDFGDGDANLAEVKEKLTTQLSETWKVGQNEWLEIVQAHDNPLFEAAMAGVWLRIPQHLEAFGSIPLVETSDELVDYMARVLFDEGGGPVREGVLSGKAFVSVQDIHIAVYDFFGGYVETEVLDDAIRGLLAGKGSDAKLRIAPIVPALFVGGKHVKPTRAPISKYVPGGVLNTEAKVLQLATVETSSGVLEPSLVNDYLTRTIAEQTASGRHVLATEQQMALRHLLTSTSTATLLMGAQGSGKTTLFSHFGKLAASNGAHVWGLAPQGTAVNKLGDTLRKIDQNAVALTIESFVFQVRFGSLTIPENTCIILDESSQVDTIELAEVLEIVTEAKAKLILVGDDRQLGSVRYGGMFATLFAMVGGARLVETRRAADPWDRTAQGYLRKGDLKGALRIYEQKGRISVVDDGLALLEQAGKWLRREFTEGSDSFVITQTKAEEMAANDLAHRIWDGYRKEWLKTHLDAQVRHHRMSEKIRDTRMERVLNSDPTVSVEFSGSELSLRMGDLVAIRKSMKINSNTRLSNGQRGRIVDITDKSITLFVQEESTARHVTIPRDSLKPGAISYGWASTVFRTQAMELGSSEGQVAIADDYSLAPDTPVLVKRSTHRSKTLSGTFLEDLGEKVSIRLDNGKIRRVAKSRISLADDTKERIERLIVSQRDGNALVIGSEAMNLDAFLVSASRARQRTNFLFRSVMATENDFAGEQLIDKSVKEELAKEADGQSDNAADKELVRSTLMLYLARQSRADQPDSAYLMLAREREALTLATNVPLPILESLRSWLSDNVASGVLEITIDDSSAVAQSEAATARKASLQEKFSTTSDLQLQAHLLAEIDGCEAEIAYAEREILQMKVFSQFVGHASSALSNREGKVVVDERYVKDRLSLVDDAIEMASNMDSWVDIPENMAIEVPLPENTAREVVDLSAEDQVNLDTKARLFQSVSYKVASDWMKLANGLYDRMLADSLSVDEVLATIEVSDDNRLRLRECLATVAVARLHPSPVNHPVTLRGVQAEAISEGVDEELVAFVEQLTESIDEHRNRRAERGSLAQYSPDAICDADDELADIWDDYAALPVDGHNWVAEGEEPPPVDYYGEDDEDHYFLSPEVETPQQLVSAEEDSALANDSLDEGELIDSSQSVDCELEISNETATQSVTSTTASNVVDTNNGSMLDFLSKDLDDFASSIDNKVAAVIKATFLTPVTTNEREYHRGFFYKSTDGAWKVDEKRRQKLIVELGDVVSREHFVDLFNITKAIKIDNGEIYIPSKETLAEAERMHRLRQIAIEGAEQGGKSSIDENDKGSGKGDSKGSGKGYGKS